MASLSLAVKAMYTLAATHPSSLLLAFLCHLQFQMDIWSSLALAALSPLPSKLVRSSSVTFRRGPVSLQPQPRATSWGKSPRVTLLPYV